MRRNNLSKNLSRIAQEKQAKLIIPPRGGLYVPQPVPDIEWMTKRERFFANLKNIIG